MKITTLDGVEKEYYQGDNTAALKALRKWPEYELWFMVTRDNDTDSPQIRRIKSVCTMELRRRDFYERLIIVAFSGGLALAGFFLGYLL